MSDSSLLKKRIGGLELPSPPPPPPAPTIRSPIRTLKSANNVPSIEDVIAQRFTTISIDWRTQTLVYKNLNTIHVPQVGPTCGLAALLMALGPSETKHNLPTLLKLAKDNNITYQGEAFSASDLHMLAELAKEDSSSIDIELVNLNSFESHNSRLSLILLKLLSKIRDATILVPYDKDKNHEPALNSGHNAHWALITGVCFPKPRSDASGERAHLIRQSDDLSDLTEAAINRSESVHVFARHGLSPRLAIWNVNSLLESCMNLREVNPTRTVDQYRIPQNSDLISSLSGQIIVIRH